MTTGTDSEKNPEHPGGASAASSEPSAMEKQEQGDSPQRKKRGAGDDFRKGKDDAESDEEGDGATGTGTWARADDETLKSRRSVVGSTAVDDYEKSPDAMQLDDEASQSPSSSSSCPTTDARIIKARRPPVSEDRPATSTEGEAAAPNPFAGISLGAGGGGSAPAASSSTTPFSSGGKTNLFAKALGDQPGTGFGGSGGFGGAASTGGFSFGGAGGFAGYKTSNPFTAALPAGGGGGFASSSSKGTSAFGGEASKTAFGAPAEGEDEEGGDGAGEEDVEAEVTNATFKVPKVQGLKDASYKALTGEEDWTIIMETPKNSPVKLYKLTVVKDKSSGEHGKANGSAAGGGGQGVRRDWVEAGLGVVKVLEKTNEDGSVVSRVVFRREPGVVLINVYLKEPVGVAKHADKALRIAFLEEQAQPATYVMRFKSAEEMESMLAEMDRRIKATSA